MTSELVWILAVYAGLSALIWAAGVRDKIRRTKRRQSTEKQRKNRQQNGGIIRNDERGDGEWTLK